MKRQERRALDRRRPAAERVTEARTEQHVRAHAAVIADHEPRRGARQAALDAVALFLVERPEVLGPAVIEAVVPVLAVVAHPAVTRVIQEVLLERDRDEPLALDLGLGLGFLGWFIGLFRARVSADHRGVLGRAVARAAGVGLARFGRWLGPLGLPFRLL